VVWAIFAIMLRRQTRLRKEYLLKKAQEQKEKVTFEKKKKLKEAVEAGKPIPTELKNEEVALRKEMDLEGVPKAPSSHMDDEYRRSGIEDPKVIVTTSRDPSSRLTQFAKEMRLVFPNAQKINRGNYVLKEIADACRSNDVTDLIIFHEHRGEPDGMIISHFPYGPTAYFSLHNVVLRHDIQNRGTVSEQYPHLIFDNFNSSLGERTKSILKYLFPVPKPDSQRVMTFSNSHDFISYRHHVYQKFGHNKVELMEVGPRFEMKLYQITLGTIDITEADKEWVARPYMNTSKKRDFL